LKISGNCGVFCDKKAKKVLAFYRINAKVLLAREASASTLNSTTIMILPFPADSDEYQEYVSVMEADAREDLASYAPQPQDYDSYYDYDCDGDFDE
jgi:hypothetical protein